MPPLLVPVTRRSALPLLALILALSACASAGTTHRAASVVDYLYPHGREVVVAPSIPPRLTLPLRIGVAFVPSASDAATLATVVPESERQRLMNLIADHFRQQAYVGHIETIPTAYLTPGGGFTNLEQIGRTFDVDVVALLSYDQMQFTSTARSSIVYWTLLGAYAIEGEKNDTRTLLDAAVFDVASRKLLFRAPGVSTVKGSATPIDVGEARRRDGARGFDLAASDLLGNLDTELAAFQAKVREAKTDVQIVRTAEYDARARRGGGGAGGGSADAVLALASATLGVGALLRRYRRAA
jgi:rhombotail lipoprotein